MYRAGHRHRVQAAHRTGTTHAHRVRADAAGDDLPRRQLVDGARRLQGDHIVPVGPQRPADRQPPDPAAGLDADRDGAQPDLSAANQALTRAARGRDVIHDFQDRQVLAHLHPDRAVAVCRDALEAGAGQVAVVDVEAASADAVRGDRRLYVEPIQRAEAHVADPARSVRGDRRAGGPAAHGPPATQRHVVGAMGGDRAVVDHRLDASGGDDVHAAADQVRRARLDAAVGIHRPGAEQVDLDRPGHEDAAARIGASAAPALIPTSVAVRPGASDRFHKVNAPCSTSTPNPCGRSSRPRRSAEATVSPSTST